MATAPISDQVFLVSRSALDESAPTLAAIDRGCSLTKAVYVAKDGDGNTATHYALHCALFANSEFEGCLHFLKAKALLPSSGSIRVTGTGCDMYNDVIEKILGLKVEFRDEFLSAFRGVHFLLSNMEDRESAFYPPTSIDSSTTQERTPEMDVMIKQRLAKLTRNDGPDPNALFPCVYILFGSATLAMMIDEEGKARLCTGSLLGGKSLLGLGRALAGTANYDELLELAKNGNCGNVDTTVEEFLKEDPNSPYAKFPRNLPMFPLGKLVDHNEELSEYSREDRAAAAVRLVGMNNCQLIISAMNIEGLSRVVVGGHGIRGENIRAVMNQFMRVFLHIPRDIKYLKTGSTGAIGAMISKPDDMAKFMQPT